MQWYEIGRFLIIAGINFMNLSVARSMNRSKEVGLRKVIGANKDQIVKQFLSESVILSFFSFMVFSNIFLIEIVITIHFILVCKTFASQTIIQTF